MSRPRIAPKTRALSNKTNKCVECRHFLLVESHGGDQKRDVASDPKRRDIIFCVKMTEIFAGCPLSLTGLLEATYG